MIAQSIWKTISHCTLAVTVSICVWANPVHAAPRICAADAEPLRVVVRRVIAALPNDTCRIEELRSVEDALDRRTLIALEGDPELSPVRLFFPPNVSNPNRAYDAAMRRREIEYLVKLVNMRGGIILVLAGASRTGNLEQNYTLSKNRGLGLKQLLVEAGALSRLVKVGYGGNQIFQLRLDDLGTLGIATNEISGTGSSAAARELTLNQRAIAFWIPSCALGGHGRSEDPCDLATGNSHVECVAGKVAPVPDPSMASSVSPISTGPLRPSDGIPAEDAGQSAEPLCKTQIAKPGGGQRRRVLLLCDGDLSGCLSSFIKTAAAEGNKPDLEKLAVVFWAKHEDDGVVQVGRTEGKDVLFGQILQGKTARRELLAQFREELRGKTLVLNGGALPALPKGESITDVFCQLDPSNVASSCSYTPQRHSPSRIAWWLVLGAIAACLWRRRLG